jgi:hypothetical protein
MIDDPAPFLAKAYNDLLGGVTTAANALETRLTALPSDRAFVESKMATTFILAWMRTHYLWQKQFNGLFNCAKSSSAADQFTAAVALTLERFLHAHHLSGHVRSEVSLKKKKGAPRPDISIWANDERVVSVIECKTNLGYQRTGWKSQYYERTNKFLSLHPGSVSFLCVLTKDNWQESWPAFMGSPLFGKRWFCLSKVWPTELGDNLDAHVGSPIEPMFLEIREALATGGAAAK